MEHSKQQRIRELTDRLNRCRYEYYNLNAPSLTDAEYDALFDELSALEKETGFNLTNSPTQTVGCYPAVSTLEKTTHKIPLLSLDKTKSSTELLRFAGEQMVMLMLKLDGLTVKLTYEKGLLMEAATRGDGDTGENITHNVMGISGIPDKISYKERLVVTGEAFIRPSDFAALKDTLRDGNGEPYKNGRNLAAGSVRLLDCGACKDRRVTFMAFNVLEGLTEEYPWKSQRLRAIEQLGFPVCKYLASKQALTQFDMDAGIRHLRKYAQENDIPIDGIVVTYNDAAYAKSCGRTGHHYLVGSLSADIGVSFGPLSISLGVPTSADSWRYDIDKTAQYFANPDSAGKYCRSIITELGSNLMLAKVGDHFTVSCTLMDGSGTAQDPALHRGKWSFTLENRGTSQYSDRVIPHNVGISVYKV